MTDHLSEMMMNIGIAARAASRRLAVEDRAKKDQGLVAIADQIERSSKTILQANAEDIKIAVENQTTGSFVDRLKLDQNRVSAIAQSVREIARLPDPVGRVLSTTIRPNGLHVDKIATPIGVIGVIFESRPNVTADAAALCLKSGNAVVLRGGSAAYHSNRAIYQAIKDGLTKVPMDTDVIQFVVTTDRGAVGEMLTGLNGNIDVIVPRGGKSLVGRVQEDARVPVFSHLEGICHTYVHKEADPAMARDIVVNAKMRRPGICGATETLLIDQAIALEDLVTILEALVAAGCEIRGDDAVCEKFENCRPAVEQDWSTEYLAPIISVRQVPDIQQAVDHISRYGTNHTDSIITDDAQAAQFFACHVDSAIVMHNASTQFADGGEFGMGAEIGIATGKLHARGPVGLEQLTTFKYVVRGNGQIRP